jgi:sec-independent protein translocase protein TatA
MFGNLGLPELIVIFVIILIFFGPKRAPEIGTGLGEAMRNFKKGLGGDESKDDKR